ncbi:MULTISPECIES: thiol-disulfide oxidoreductase DCC family protein [Bacillus amyloliquefaciens group]|uniref:thiol-disulfide oxidoreductase DCC family protein n=1 Tax=Bacillus amyloliquefaciens group TaxID=1938374 RepID=UPI001F4C9CF7|nr:MULTISPECIES: thiol-disulfide oxidoreductase DCC family protein [Bacillus amyloliquefaciens group]MED3511257.1 thiol-disulfide oxidoreductase DCC family protein [Bacillus velezensis]UNE52274.1 thiol-disulfide oxidoreductase DCC family protein [Bacillus amyloliquefaciens]
MKPAQLPDRVLLFDGVCNLCSGAVQFIIKRDPAGKISFASLQSDTARELLASEGLPTEQFDSMIFIENGRIYKKSAAVLKVSRHLRGAWRLSAVFFAVPRPLRDRAYSFIARRRYQWFGKREACMLPSPEIKNRFLS